MQKRKWYKLDNVGTFYSFTNNKKIPAVFRYSVTLTEPINPKFLQDALNKTVEIYPNFNVELKKGFFWHYLVSVNQKPKIDKENLPICEKTYKDSDDILFRVNYYKNRINFEVSHILSDGRGSLQFFKTLITKYLCMRYLINDIKIIDYSSEFEKSEDSFDKYYKKDKRKIEKVSKIYKYKGKKSPNITYMEYHLPTDKVLFLAHSYNTTLTGLLLSILIYAFKEEMKEREIDKLIKIDLPVDLRQFFKSSTSRNFFWIRFNYI